VIRATVSSRARHLRESLADARVREATAAATLAGSLAALFAWLGPPGNDLAAHEYLRWQFLQHGLVFWNNYWYSGRYSYITYSPLYYPLAGLLGIRLLATVSIVASAFAFSMLLGRQWGRRARWSSRSFAVLWAGIVFSAAFPFALGAMLAIFAVWALQAGGRRRFAFLSLLTLLASPLAFASCCWSSRPSAWPAGRMNCRGYVNRRWLWGLAWCSDCSPGARFRPRAATRSS
jgi:uncharacterized metal-binding protein